MHYFRILVLVILMENNQDVFQEILTLQRSEETHFVVSGGTECNWSLILLIVLSRLSPNLNMIMIGDIQKS